MPFDLLLRNARVVDGSGNPWYRADVAIAGGRIAAVGMLGSAEAREIIDVAEHCLCPGFIDTHSHSDLLLLVEPLNTPKLLQGITTDVLGQDGLGVAPLRAEHVALWRRHLAGLQGDPPLDWTWRSFADYLHALERARPAVNVAVLATHGAVRLHAMGMAQRAPQPAELAAMRAQIREALAAGAVGFSTGLEYTPCSYADTDELVALCREVAPSGGCYVTHMRNEGPLLLEALGEALAIAQRAGLPLLVSHLKAKAPAFQPLLSRALAMMEQARAQGIDVTFDQYPYGAGSTMLSALVPGWAHEGGPEALLARLDDPVTRERLMAAISPGAGLTWDDILLSAIAADSYRAWEGQTLGAIARAEKRPAPALVLELLRATRLGAAMIRFWGHDDNVARALAHPLGMLGTDALMIGSPHPRTYGSTARILGHFVRERGTLRLEEAVRRMTSLPAQRLGLADRGLVRPGLWADLVVFDPARIADRATYAEPRQHPVGIDLVVVNGAIAARDGRPTGARAGHVLRRR
jgi:N-acyl-D-amino-acid deacylase